MVDGFEAWLARSVRCRPSLVSYFKETPASCFSRTNHTSVTIQNARPMPLMSTVDDTLIMSPPVPIDRAPHLVQALVAHLYHHLRTSQSHVFPVA